MKFFTFKEIRIGEPILICADLIWKLEALGSHASNRIIGTVISSSSGIGVEVKEHLPEVLQILGVSPEDRATMLTGDKWKDPPFTLSWPPDRKDYPAAGDVSA